MQKERAMAVQQEVGTEAALTRTTCFLSKTQDYNLDVLALHSGKSKGNLIREGIAMVLKQNGFPDNDRVQIHIGGKILSGNGRNADTTPSGDSVKR